MRLSIIGTQPNQWSYGQDWLSMIPFFYRVTIIWARIRMSNSAGFSGRRMVSWDDGLPVLFTHGFQCEFIGPWMTGLIPSLPWNSSQSTSKAMFSCRTSHQPRHSPRPCRRIRGQWFRMLYISLGVISLLFSFIFLNFYECIVDAAYCLVIFWEHKWFERWHIPLWACSYWCDSLHGPCSTFLPKLHIAPALLVKVQSWQPCSQFHIWEG